MVEAQDKLREHARKLLNEDTVRLVIGYRRGADPHRVAPAFIERPEHVEQLVLDPLCSNNLANYLPKRDEPVAVVVKGCDARAVRVLLIEHQIKREQVHIIGWPCRGIVDPRKLERTEGVDLEAFESVTREGEEFTVVSGGSRVRVPANDLLRNECVVCRSPSPVIHDMLLTDPVETWSGGADDPDLAPIAQMSAEQRLVFFDTAFSRCLRCYACVKACPLCYCTTCFAEQTKPRWLIRRCGMLENRMFHLGRAMHLAGRCVDCGACDSACPVDMPLRELNAALVREVEGLFGYVAGADPEALPPFLTFEPGDTEEAIDGARA